MNIEFTKFTAKSQRLVKSALIVDGEIDTEGATNFFKGKFETISCPWTGFGDYLESVQSNECLGLGICALKDNNGKTVTCAKIKVKDEVISNDFKTIARVKGNFEWASSSRLIYLDIDHISSTSQTPTEALSDLLQKLPELNNIQSGFWLKPSSSAYLVSDNDSTGLSGLHCYFLLPDIYDIEDFKAYVSYKSWEGNNVRNAFSKGLCAKILDYHACDISVFSPMRLVYEGDPICSTEISVDAKRKQSSFVETFGDDILDLHAYDKNKALLNKRRKHLNLRSEQASIRGDRHKADRIKNGRSKKEQNRIKENLSKGVFPSSLIVHTDNHGDVPAWKFLIDPEFWHEKSCRDPEEPNYDGGSKGKAKIFTNGGGCRIHSFAHGEHVDRVVWDLRSIKEVFDQYSERELEDMGLYWEDIVAKASISKGVNEVEVNKIKDIVQERMKVNKDEVNSRVASAGNSAGRDKITNALTEFNKVWCMCPVSNKVRYFKKQFDARHGVDYFKAFDKESMRSLESNNIVKVFNGKKMIDVVISDQWLKWEEMRKYKGCYFNPHHDPSRGELKNGCFNLYEGHAISRATLRGKRGKGWSCGKKKCKGLGCFKWSVDNGFKVCKEKVGTGGGNWTYYVNHIYNIICGDSGENKAEQTEHALWVLDWLIETIQRPDKGFPWSRGATSKPCTSLVVRGGSGDGKGSLFAPLQKILGKYSRQIKSMKQLTARFNAFSIDNILLFADEATWGGGHEAAGILKGLITEEMNETERKGVDSEETVSHTRLAVSSNTAWVIPTELDDRRFSVFDVGNDRHKDFDYFNKVNNNSVEQFLDLCLDWEITSALHRNVDNDALNNQKIQNDITAEQEFLVWLWKGMEAVEKSKVVTVDNLKAQISSYFETGEKELETMVIYRRFNKVLKAFGVTPRGKKVRKLGGGSGERDDATDFAPLTTSPRWKKFYSLYI